MNPSVTQDTIIIICMWAIGWSMLAAWPELIHVLLYCTMHYDVSVRECMRQIGDILVIERKVRGQWSYSEQCYIEWQVEALGCSIMSYWKHLSGWTASQMMACDDTKKRM